MNNEYGAPLDRNGYAPSIVQEDTGVCFLCGRSDQKLDRHECFGGAGRRAKSKRLGLWVSLCHTGCHQNSAWAVHENPSTAAILHGEAQAAAMQTYGWGTGRFIAEFGRNYRTEEKEC